MYQVKNKLLELIIVLVIANTFVGENPWRYDGQKKKGDNNKEG
jgi:hypothetical protein